MKKNLMIIALLSFMGLTLQVGLSSARPPHPPHPGPPPPSRWHKPGPPPPDIVKPDESMTGRVIIASRVLHVRCGPGLDFPIIGRVYEGNTLTFHGKSANWLYVLLPNGQFGWISENFTRSIPHDTPPPPVWHKPGPPPPDIVEPDEPATGRVIITSRVLHVRCGPGLDFPIIGRVFEGNILKFHGKSANWLYVLLPDGQFGWISERFTQFIP